VAAPDVARTLEYYPKSIEAEVFSHKLDFEREKNGDNINIHGVP
jgi:hypothetical protein